MRRHRNHRFAFHWLMGFIALSWGFAGCNYLFYYPNQFVYATPDHYHLSYESVDFNSSDGTPLKGWFIPALTPDQAKGTVIQFHGNAENMTSHFRSLIWLPYHGYNLFTFDYRGFGQSGGEPELYGPLDDSIAAIEYVQTRLDWQSAPLILIGQSVGGALAIAAAAHSSKQGVHAIIIESSFSSYQRITRDKLGEVSLTWPLQWPLSLLLIRDTYSPDEWVDQLAPIPVLFIHGTEDPVVAYYHSEILYQTAKEPKFFWTIEGGAHTQAFTRFGDVYRGKLLDFLENQLPEE